MERIVKYFLVIILITTSCDKEGRIISIDKELPPITTSGENTFGCLMNGEVWTPYIPLSLFPPGSSRLVAYYNKEFGNLKIEVNRIIPEKSIDDCFKLYADSIFNVGRYCFSIKQNEYNYFPETLYSDRA